MVQIPDRIDGQRSELFCADLEHSAGCIHYNSELNTLCMKSLSGQKFLKM